MNRNRPLIRRTFLQERFEILISRQKRGIATFAELTELDDIVNRNGIIREQVLEEMHNAGPGDTIQDKSPDNYYPKKQGFDLLAVFRSWFSRFSFSHFNPIKNYILFNWLASDLN